MKKTPLLVVLLTTVLYVDAAPMAFSEFQDAASRANAVLAPPEYPLTPAATKALAEDSIRMAQGASR